MTVEKNEEKLAQFEEFFSIKHAFNVNISLLEHNQDLSYEAFVNSIPLPFKMASDMVSLDQAALRPLQALSGVAGQLVEYLNHQSHKIELLVGYILSQEDEKNIRYQGIAFGGGGITIETTTPFNLGQLVQLKIFFPDENCAVFCHGEILDVNTLSNENRDDDKDTAQSYSHKIVFHHIREEDREILVRTSLHQQSKQLQALAKKRHNSSVS